MKLEVGMYVRTKEGFIAKIQYIDEDSGGIDCDSSVKTMYEEHYSCLWGSEVKELVVKASHNLLGNDKEPCLIDAGDYVNGRKVYQVGYNFADEFVLKMSKSNYEDFIYPNEIETIVTKEQFESMSYKVG